MIDFDQVSVSYPSDQPDRFGEPVLREVSVGIDEGELVLLIGSSGSGKSTLLRAVNGLVPHFTGGLLTGRVQVAGRDTRDWRPRDLADVVQLVGQDPLRGFVTDNVEDELAYTMESLGVPPAVMRVRVEETLDLLGIAELRGRPLASLSGGQQQRVAIGAALTAHPKVLVLDEPTSALDPQAAEEVLAAIQRLVFDLGMTVLMAEHRLERVIQYADRILEIGGGRLVADGTPDQVMSTAAVAPAVIRLGRRLGWQPLPVSVRDARRRAASLRRELESEPLAMGGPGAAGVHADPLVECRQLVLRYSRGPGSEPVQALRGVDLRVHRGEVVALMGRNGSGKSSLLKLLTNLVRPSAGTIRVGGLDPVKARPRELAGRIGLVPQDPGDLLWAATVAEECRNADADHARPEGACAALLDTLAPDIDPRQHPRDLSEGQRMCLALAVVLTGEPPLLLLDEPTRGLDYGAKRRLADQLRGLAATGHGIVLATHDVELVAELATRVVVLAEGEVVADGPAREVITGSPMFAPQVAKVLSPLPVLTLDELDEVLR